MERKIFQITFVLLGVMLKSKISTASICSSSPVVINNTESGNFTSPNYPRDYPNNTVKTWKIVAAPGHVIDLYFEAFKLETGSICRGQCGCDYVKIRNKCDDAVPVATYCGYIAKPVRSKSNVVWVEFKSDSTQTFPGFEAIFTTALNPDKLISCPRPQDNQANIDYCLREGKIQCCNKNTTMCRYNRLLTATSGTITSPGFPDKYPHNTMYIWRITAPDGFLVHLSFTKLITDHSQQCNTPSKCSCDFVSVRDGACKYNSGIKWCGDWSSNTPSFKSNGRHMLVTFHSDSSGNHDGFSANYRIEPNCTGLKPISCIINGQPSCCNGEVKTCLSGTSKRSHCPRDFDPASHNVCCVVNSVPSCCHNPSSSICAKPHITINAKSGKISSPNYPSPYPHNTTKIWKITGPVGQVIELYFEAFALEKNNDCSLDFVQIRDECNDIVPLKRYCGSVAKPIRSSSNVVWVEFRSDLTVNEKGFKAFFASVSKSSKRISCPRPSDNQANIDYCLERENIGCCNNNNPLCKVDKLLTDSNGKITSPNYPDKYPHSTAYVWRVTVPEGYVVQLNFTKLNIDRSALCSECNCDYVGVRDGPCSTYAGKKWCGSARRKLPSFISTGRHLVVEFKSDSVFNHDGFEAKYRRALKCSGEAPYSCLANGLPACCKTPSTASAIKLSFILVVLTTLLPTIVS